MKHRPLAALAACALLTAACSGGGLEGTATDAAGNRPGVSTVASPDAARNRPAERPRASLAPADPRNAVPTVAPTEEPADRATTGPADRDAAVEPISTFALDVDTASYGYARRLLREGTLPSPGQVRPEEFVNAFRQDYPQPPGDGFSVHLDGARLPGSDTALLRVGLQTREAEQGARRSRAWPSTPPGSPPPPRTRRSASSPSSSAVPRGGWADRRNGLAPRRRDGGDPGGRRRAAAGVLAHR